VTGTITAVNDELADAPERLNEDPYGDGWIIAITMTDATQVESLLTAYAYVALIED
jgi:glycine cleavage system H protein